MMVGEMDRCRIGRNVPEFRHYYISTALQSMLLSRNDLFGKWVPTNYRLH